MGSEPKLGLHETFRRRQVHLLNSLCSLSLHPVTSGNSNRFYFNSYSSDVLQFNNFGYNPSFYGKMAAITYIKIDQGIIHLVCTQNFVEN